MTAENGDEELPGGVHGQNDEMDKLINKYIGEEDEDDLDDTGAESDYMKSEIAESEALFKQELMEKE